MLAKLFSASPTGAWNDLKIGSTAKFAKIDYRDPAVGVVFLFLGVWQCPAYTLLVFLPPVGQNFKPIYACQWFGVNVSMYFIPNVPVFGISGGKQVSVTESLLSL